MSIPVLTIMSAILLSRRGSYKSNLKDYNIVTLEEDDGKTLKVSAGSNAQSVGSAIAHALYETPQIKLRAIGASAVNQAVKAIAISSGYVAPRGLNLACRPGFTTVNSRDGEITAVTFTIWVS